MTVKKNENSVLRSLTFSLVLKMQIQGCQNWLSKRCLKEGMHISSLKTRGNTGLYVNE